MKSRLKKSVGALASILFLLAVGCSHSRDTATPTTITTVQAHISEDHWHTAVGFYICGEFLSPKDIFLPHPPNSNSSSLKNGVLHISPTPDSSSQLRLRLTALIQENGIVLADDTISFLEFSNRMLTTIGATNYDETTQCNGRPSSLSVTRWKLAGATQLELDSPQVFSENLATIEISENLEAYTIALLPVGSDIPPIPLGALEMLKLPEVKNRNDIPTPQNLRLVPARPLPAPAGETITQQPIPCPRLTGERRVTQFSSTLPTCIDSTKTYTATFITNMGDIIVKLNPDTPQTTNAFVLLARYHYYDGSALFRTDPRQGIVQGGAVHSNRADDRGPGFFIPDENQEITYSGGQLLMARNASPNSANGQFLFTVDDRARLLNTDNSNFVVFGNITEGVDILKRIVSLHVDDPTVSSESAFFSGGPILPVILKGVAITESSTPN